MAPALCGEHVADGSALSALEARLRWLGHPAFLAEACVLALNDHVLKDRFPGWWTGKLSDFAGLALAASLAAVLFGPRRGLVLAGIGFVALKTVPGIAELARPVLGGITLRDQTDLVALAVLAPLSRFLRRRVRCEQQGGVERSLGHRARDAVLAGLPIVGAVFAVVTATATSCGPSPAVVMVASDGRALYALLDEGWDDAEIARSDDGGETWSSIERAPAKVQLTARPHDVFDDPGPSGPLEACAIDGTCWRLRGQRVIERSTSDGRWVAEFRLSERTLSDISTGCSGGQIGILGSIATAETADGSAVVASYGADGVLVRTDVGGWDQIRVLSAPPIEATRVEEVAARQFLLLSPVVLGLTMWLIGRRRWSSWRRGLIAILVGWGATLLIAGAIGFLAGTDTDPDISMGRAVMIGMLVTTVGAVVVARRPGTTAKRAPEIPERPDLRE